MEEKASRMLNCQPSQRKTLFARYIWSCLICGIGLVFGVETLLAQESPKLDFLREVYPIFQTRCFGCHGPGKQMGGLRLDLKESARQGGKSGPSIIPSKSAESLLVQLIREENSNRRMPKVGRPLSGEEIARISAWIDQGAEWIESGTQESILPTHWSFLPITCPPVPAVNMQDWSRNPIDAFVLASLKEKGVTPSPDADRPVLVRRLYLDLIGLLPTPQEVAEFLQDQSPDAYEQVVDQLLASPHFGERWGRFWLDQARYADSDGYEKDNPRPYAWRYRDWVIDAVNRDLPYDEFSIEQLAGDLLPHPTLDQLSATGFNRNTLTNTEGGVDQEEFRVLAVKDRVSTMGSIWMGLTVGCAECHNHKYDPIAQKEFYQLYAFFNSAKEENLKIPLEEERFAYEKEKNRFDLVHHQLENAVNLYKDVELPHWLQEWDASFKRSRVTWQPLTMVYGSSLHGATLAVESDGSIQAENPESATDTFTLTLKSPLSAITAIRLEVDPVSEDSSKNNNSRKPFEISEIKIWAVPEDQSIPAYPVPLLNASADASGENNPAQAAIDGRQDTGWSVDAYPPLVHSAVFETTGTAYLSGNTMITLQLDQLAAGRRTLSHFQLFVTDAERPVSADSLPVRIMEIVKIPSGERTRGQRRELLAYFALLDSTLQTLTQALREHDENGPAAPKSFLMAMAEDEKAPTAHIQIRGDFLRPADEVEPTVPAVLPPLHPRAGRPDRLDLARWLVSPENPLTARVAVNQVWAHLFGRGLVESLDDFGTRGDPPTNPQLLDWLASTYRDLHWSRKALIKTIVMSSTYRQASITRTELVEKDPLNRGLARQNRFRLEAEIVRDLCLQTSGLLYDRIGGPSIRPPLPADIAALGYANSVKWAESPGREKYRRGMYIFFQRTVPYPMLVSFDSPEGTLTCPRRERSNTPLQALNLLNDPVFFECAQHFGQRLQSEGGSTPEEKIRYAFRLALAREPEPVELASIKRLFNDVRDMAQSRPPSAEAITGDTSADPASAAETTAWISVARTVMNVEEFFTRE